VYRPNEAKVKNLRAKDYLGKAKLVAAVDRNNAFTGFTGAEIKKMNGPDGAKDDRPEEKISFAASNLVKTDLRSRNRQQSEPPPLNRNVFPPTPPPEGDRSSQASSSNNGPSMTRADSVRAGPRPRPLDLSVAGFERPRQPPPMDELPRPPVRSRTQSERPIDRAPQRRSSERRGPPPPAGATRGVRSPESYRSARGSREEEYDDVYDMYGRTSMGGRNRMPPPRPQFIAEDDEDDYMRDYDDTEFEMVGGGPGGRFGAGPPQSSYASQNYARSSRGTGGSGRKDVDVKKIRVKVHADDTRYVMIGPAVEFKDFVEQIRNKFGIRQSFKLKIKDEGDMITMADQDDLEMAIHQSKMDARKENTEMGKMEVSSCTSSIPIEKAHC
jgi:hypothetical protein